MALTDDLLQEDQQLPPYRLVQAQLAADRIDLGRREIDPLTAQTRRLIERADSLVAPPPAAVAAARGSPRLKPARTHIRHQCASSP